MTHYGEAGPRPGLNGGANHKIEGPGISFMVAAVRADAGREGRAGMAPMLNMTKIEVAELEAAAA